MSLHCINMSSISLLLFTPKFDTFFSTQQPERQSPIHVALRLGRLEATKMLLEAPNFDVTSCDAYHRGKVCTAIPATDVLIF